MWVDFFCQNDTSSSERRVSNRGRITGKNKIYLPSAHCVLSVNQGRSKENSGLKKQCSVNNRVYLNVLMWSLCDKHGTDFNFLFFLWMFITFDLTGENIGLNEHVFID